MGGENLHEVRFENCELPIENLVVRDDGFVRLLTAFNTQRCLNPSISLGLAEGAFEEAVRYARERQAFGRPIGEFQGMRWKLAEMYKEIETGRSILYRACATANPFPDPHLAAVAKIFCNDGAARDQRRHPGAWWLRLHDEYAVSRFYRGARYGTLGGGIVQNAARALGKADHGRA
jgi:alkylation response protein AidB-like acyl-CoA dehydrogenase